MTLKVLIVDDHTIVREGIARMLSDAGDIRVAAEAETGEAALELLDRDACDVCILDMSMPGMGGVETLTEIRRRHPGVAVLALSMHSEREYGLRCLNAGAAGYLTKGHRPDELVDAVRTVAAGRRYLTPEMAELLVTHPSDDGSLEPHERLSQREFDVFRRLARGESSSEIAAELAISIKTVSTYRARVLAKMGMTRNAEMVAYAIKHHLADGQPGIS